jgi:uncharacterized protein with HEPN domain
MKKREYRDYLNDIAESIDDAISFIKGMTYREFLKDRKTINAVSPNPAPSAILS